MKKFGKLLLSTTVVVVLLIVAYAVGLSYRLLPVSLTPEVLFKAQYPEFKQKLAKDVASKDASSSSAKAILDFLNKVEETYRLPAEEKPVDATSVPVEKTAESDQHAALEGLTSVGIAAASEVAQVEPQVQ